MVKRGIAQGYDIPADPCIVPPPLDSALVQEAPFEAAQGREHTADRGTADAMESLRALGRTLRRVRKLSGLSQGVLANLAGVTQSGLSRFESGRQVGLVVLIRLGRVLPRMLPAGVEAMLSEETRRLLDAIHELSSPTPDLRSVTRTPGLEELLNLYHRASRMARDTTLAILRILAR